MLCRYTLPVRDLPRGKTQRMKLPVQAPAADPSGARGKQGIETLRLKASQLLSNVKALAHHGTCILLLEVRCPSMQSGRWPASQQHGGTTVLL